MTTPPQAQPPAGRRDEVLQLLRDARVPVGIAEIAERLGIHANTARFHLDTLVGNGQVERTTAGAGTPGRPPQLFQTARGMDPMGPRNYRMLAEVLVASLAGEPDPAHRSVEAGRAWGRLHASTFADTAEGGEQVGATESIGRLTTMLNELGFAPDLSEGGDSSQIGLRNCPFLDLAVDRADVVCPVHLGLMQGAMASWGSTVTVDRLDAFVEPDRCVAHLGQRSVRRRGRRPAPPAPR